MGPVTDKGIGRAIQAGRQHAGILQSELSERLWERGLTWSQATISKVERGDRPVRATELPVVAEALDMDVTDLFTPWESGLQLSLRDAARRERQLEEEFKAIQQEHARVAERVAEVSKQLEEARTQAEALRVLIDFTRGTPDVEAVSWSGRALLDYWKHRLEPRLGLGDLMEHLGDDFAEHVMQNDIIDLEEAFPNVLFGHQDAGQALDVQWRKT
jgi:transcriptional regulator with XRE-family HTH domain